MFKFLTIFAIATMAAAAPGFISQHQIVQPVVHSVPSAVSHQSITQYHSQPQIIRTVQPLVPVVKHVAAPVVQTYAAPTVVKTISAPIVKTVQTPIVSHAVVTPVVKQVVAAPVLQSYSAPVVKTIVQSAPVVRTVYTASSGPYYHH